MAFLNLEDVYGSLECVCFPAIYEKVKAFIGNDKIVKMSGKLEIDPEKGLTCIVDDLTEVSVSENKKEQTASEDIKISQEVLWLNTSNLSEEDFNDLLNTLSNYEGNTVCKILRKDKRFTLTSGINYCRGLLAELYAILEQKDIKYVE